MDSVGLRLESMLQANAHLVRWRIHLVSVYFGVAHLPANHAREVDDVMNLKIEV